MIDLHSHTTASDGLLAPAAVVDRAKSVGITVLGIADHDTVAGLAEAMERAAACGVELVPGIEVSSFVGDKGLHVLGYYVDHENEGLFEHDRARSAAREERIRKIVARLVTAGVAITWDEVCAESIGDVTPSRPHVARLLIRKGHAENVYAAFRDWLAEGKPGYVPYPKPDAAEAIALIERAGGVPVIAHPGLDQLVDELDDLVELGARGIEVFHNDHTEAMREQYLAYGQARGLAITGGSDFHGDGSEGGQLGATALPPEYFEGLRRAAGRL